MSEIVFTREHFKSAIQKRIFNGDFVLTEDQIDKASFFAELLHQENQSQNLTRIIGVDDFIDGHLVDVIQLFKSQQLGSVVLDIGSGGGVPGLLASAMDLDQSRIWHLCDSERNKADYLKRTAISLGLRQTVVHGTRIHECINEIKPKTIMARAVGTVDKISSWIWDCSTWNNLILFKSKGWEEEWKNAQKTRFGKKLTVTQAHEYSSGDKYRILVTLNKK